jgi:hypothetical protein
MSKTSVSFFNGASGATSFFVRWKQNGEQASPRTPQCPTGETSALVWEAGDPNFPPPGASCWACEASNHESSDNFFAAKPGDPDKQVRYSLSGGTGFLSWSCPEGCG